MRILVTGASGYIGGRLCLYLSTRGHSIAAGSRFPRSSSDELTWVATDFESPSSLASACEGVDVVIHLASLNEIRSAAEPELATLVNTLYTQRMMAAAQSAGVRRFVYFSTVHVYGSPLHGRVIETAPTYPSHPYSISHKAAEDYLAFSARNSAIRLLILRLTNSFGYPVTKDVDRWSLVTNDAARQLATTGKVALRTSGAQLRDFITLTDVCRSVEALASREWAQGTEIYNVGGECTVTVREMVERVARQYERLTGRVAVIEAPPSFERLSEETLEVDIGRLRSSGFVLRKNWDEEIAELVTRCMRWFSS